MSKYIKLEDAISKIVNTPTRVITDDLTALVDRQHEIIDMLTDLPTIEVSEDCISREWVLQMLTTYEKDRSSANELDEWQNRVVEWIEMDVKDAPSVVPKQSELTEAYTRGYKDGAEQGREEGEWEVVPMIPLDNYKCSECGAYSPCDYNYCSHCGAKMKG